jgi:hypothetical protein
MFLAGPAAALSCLRPEVGRSFEEADAREEIFVVGIGALERTGEDVPDAPPSDDPNRRVGYSFAARFEGMLATTDGFDVPGTLDVTVEVSCVSAWCGGESLSEDALYFLRRDGEDYALEARPCGGYVFEAPTEAQIGEVVRRMP